MKLELIVLIFWSVKFVFGEINQSHFTTSLLDVQKSVFDECLLCNAKTVQKSIGSYNLSSIFEGKLPALHEMLYKISKSITSVKIYRLFYTIDNMNYFYLVKYGYV